MQVSRKELRIASLYLIILLSLVKFLLLPLWDQHKILKEKLEKRLKSYEVALLIEKSEAKSFSTEISLKIFPSEYTIAYIQALLDNYIQEHVKKTKINVLDFGNANIVGNGDIQEIHFLLKAEGSIKQIFDLMLHLKEFYKIVDFKLLEIYQQETNKFVIQMIFSVYQSKI